MQFETVPDSVASIDIQFELDTPVAKSTISIGARKFRSISILTSAVFKLHHTVAVYLCKNTVGDIIFETQIPFRKLGYRNTVVVTISRQRVI